MLIAIVETNQTIASGGATLPVAAATAIVNTTTAVPSLNRLSASTSVASRFGAPRLLKVAMTDTGSVADTMAPTMNASDRSSPVAASAKATTAADTRTPGMARIATPRKVRAKLREVEAIGRLEHEARHEDDQDELRRHVERRRRPDGRDQQPEQRRGRRCMAAAIGGSAGRPRRRPR